MKSIKLKNDNYFDSSGIVHNQELLSTILSNIKDNKSNYAKMEDGTLICWGKTNLVNISAYGSAVIDINLPYSYKDTNYLVITSITDTGPYWANGFTVAGYPTSEDKIRLMLGNYLVNATAENVSGGFITIGKWK